MLIDDWRRGGISEGDTVLMHSNLRRLLRRYLNNGIRLTPEQVLESLLEALGRSGTLLLPLFNFDFTTGVAFDISTTPSQMGALTESGRRHPDAVRTGHPIYSFAVIGAQAHLFEDIVNVSGYGDDSPFAILHQLGGKIAVLDLAEQNSMTFYHHVEELLKVPYRYHKTFRGPYRDKRGHEEEREFSLFVRDLKRGVTTHVEPMGNLLWDLGHYHGDRPKIDSGLRTIDSRVVFSETEKVIKSGKPEGLLYRLEAPLN